MIQTCYNRLKAEHPELPEGDILERVARACGVTRLRVGESLREQPKIRKFAIILPA